MNRHHYRSAQPDGWWFPGRMLLPTGLFSSSIRRAQEQAHIDRPFKKIGCLAPQSERYFDNRYSIAPGVGGSHF